MTTHISLSDFGVIPDAGLDAVPALQAALDACRTAPGATLSIPPGRYDLFPERAARLHYGMSNTEPINPRTVALPIRGVDGLTVEATGATFVYHGRMMPIAIENSKHIRVNGLTIDAAVPSLCQGRVEAVEAETLDIAIEEGTDVRLEEGRLVLYGEGWSRRIWGHQLVEADGSVVYNTADGPLGELVAESLGGHRFRLRIPASLSARVGMYLIQRSGWRDHSGIFVYRSQDVTLDHVTLHFANGTGILGQRSADIRMTQCRVVPAPGRRYSTWADATHWSGLQGQLTIEDCTFAGHLDDAANVHGTSTVVAEILAPNRLVGRFKHWESVDLLWAGPGDVISFFSRRTLVPFASATVASFTAQDAETFVVEFTEPVPEGVTVDTAMDNVTWNPDFTFRRNHVSRHRARGILVSTAGKVVVEENTFASPGAAIVIAGDANGWFESGAVRDVLIRGNTFDNCNTSGYGSGAAVVHIDPVIPEIDTSALCYHSNIRIEGNRFRVFDTPYVVAQSVDGLTFCNNVIEPTAAFPPRIASPYALELDACCNVTVTGNEGTDDLPGLSVSYRRMAADEIQTEGVFDEVRG